MWRSKYDALELVNYGRGKEKNASFLTMVDNMPLEEQYEVLVKLRTMKPGHEETMKNLVTSLDSVRALPEHMLSKQITDEEYEQLKMRIFWLKIK